MKGNYGIFAAVLLVLIGILIFIVFGGVWEGPSFLIIEGIIVVAIAILLVRYFRSRPS